MVGYGHLVHGEQPFKSHIVSHLSRIKLQVGLVKKKFKGQLSIYIHSPNGISKLETKNS